MKTIDLGEIDTQKIYDYLSEEGRKEVFSILLKKAQEEKIEYIEEEKHLGLGGMMIAIGVIIIIGLCL